MLGFLFGWKHRIRGMRKRWDRLREKALKKSQPLRGQILEKLDVTEGNLRLLEEQNLGRINRAKIAKQVEIELEEISEMLRGDLKEETSEKIEEYKEKSKANF